MFIPTPKPGFLNRNQAEQELQQLIAQPVAHELRPCPNCHLPSDASIPHQYCNPDCSNAPQALSSEPDKHPIETRVVGVVFELSTLRLLQPCWSCEGHRNGQGELWKLPQVSFYAASALYPKLLVTYLNRLKHQKQLHYPWQVTLVDLGQTWGPTYQLEPALNQIMEEIKLEKLQNDLDKIGDGLGEKLKQEARFMLANMQQQ